MKKYLVEFVGTFFLVLTIGSVVMAPNDVGALAPLAIGGVLMAMVFAGGHVSGAHYNPAVTLAVFLRGKCAASEVPGYVVAQCAGAAAAAMIVAFLKGNPAVTPMQIEATRALVAEFLFTFALCTVVLNVATSQGTSGNSFYGPCHWIYRDGRRLFRGSGVGRRLQSRCRTRRDAHGALQRREHLGVPGRQLRGGGRRRGVLQAGRSRRSGTGSLARRDSPPAPSVPAFGG